RLGGHVDTAEVELDGERVAIESAVDFFWPRMYPTFSRLLRALDVRVRTYDATLTLYAPASARVYRLPPVRGGRGGRSAFAPHQLSAMLQFPGLLRRARRLVASGDTSVTVEQFVEGLGCTRAFADDFLYPLLLAGWCIEAEEFRQLAAYDPLKYLVL